VVFCRNKFELTNSYGAREPNSQGEAVASDPMAKESPFDPILQPLLESLASMFMTIEEFFTPGH